MFQGHSRNRTSVLIICNHYQKLGIKKLRENEVKTKIDNAIAKLKAEGKERDIENTIKVIKMQHQSIPDDLCYIEGQDFDDYIHNMAITQRYAKLNLNMKDMILRKGSISAREGEKVIIPMNMRDGSLICVGKGNPDWNYSAPHGAGRILSRSQAKDLVDFNEFKESMSGIYSSSVVESTIDESPMVYKPMDEIMANIKDTVDIVDAIKPIYNFKAH